MDVIKELGLRTYFSASVELLSGEHIQTNSFYPEFYGALYRQERLLKSKIKEIENFEFIPTDIDNDPEIPEHMKLYRKQIDTKLNKLRDIYGNVLCDIRISIIIFSCSLLEGIINEYLLLKSKSQSEFDRLEKNSFIKKWTEIPKQFISDYNIEPQLKNELEELYSKRRKLIIHDKPTLKENHIVKIQGKKIATAENETEFIFNLLDLPKKLISNLFNYDSDANTLGSKIWMFKSQSLDYIENRKYYTI